MKFIAFEGLDGGGKSTLIEGLKKTLIDDRKGVITTREPGGTALGKELRELLLRVNGEPPTARAELLLYIADRAQHVENVIKPALDRGDWVLSDRFSASAVAFQAGGRGLIREDIDWLNNFATQNLQPDLWVLLDLSTDEARRRMHGRELDRFESEAQVFHERVRNSYLEMANANKSQWLVLDAAIPKAALLETLLRDLRKRSWI